jgi:hypothetical protein
MASPDRTMLQEEKKIEINQLSTPNFCGKVMVTDQHAKQKKE